MGIADFFRTANSICFTLTVMFVGAYMGHFWIERGIGNIKNIQKCTIYALIRKNGASELMDVIQEIIAYDAKILMPAKSNNGFLHVVSALFLLWSLLTIFSNGWQRVFQTSWNDNWMYSLYLVLLSIAFLVLFFEYRYWVDFRRHKEEYFVPNPGSITVNQ